MKINLNYRSHRGGSPCRGVPHPASLKHKKHVQYSLMGTDIQEALKRRYSDFYALHEKLLERWPGIFVPNIPPKVVVGNLDADIIAYRIRLLNRFCLDLSNIKYLYESEEVKLFQSNSNDVAKEIEKL